MVNKVNSNCEQIRKDIQNLENNINARFNRLDQKIDDNLFNKGSIQTQIYPEGKYEGTIIDNKREGKGIFYYNNGARYEGNWKNNLKEGKGIYYYNNGIREMGDYLKDKRIGKHVALLPNGEVKVNNYYL